MAGFRMGRGRDSRPAQQRGQYPAAPQQAPGAGGGAYGQGRPQQPPYGAQGGGQGGPAGRGGRPGQGGQHPYGQHPQGQHPQGQGAPGGAAGSRRQQWPGAAQPGGVPAGGHGEPEYLGDPYANAPGHTQAFSVPDPYGQDADPYGRGDTYDAGRPSAVPTGPRLHWKELLRGIVLRPNATFWQMRDHPVWGAALTVTFIYGLLAVFGLEQARSDVINATLSSAIPYVLSTGVAVVLASLILGSVTHTLARQFGGDGSWAPTVGLSMLIMSLTDAPRLLFALFLGGTAPLVQVLGWLTWVAAGALFTSMVSRSHDLPWPKALGASAIQMIALLFLIKLGTL